jgi:ABC-type branched-subunit amino acid transport system permease subunit
MDYLFHLTIIILIYSIMTVSLDLMIGHTGILSFGHAAFYGIGAYATAILTVYAGWDWFPAMIAAVAVAAALSALVGIPTLRLGGDYFILALFGFQTILTTLIFNLDWLTNGPFGIRGIPRPSFGPYLVQSGPQIVLIISVVAALVFAAHWRIVSSPMKAMLHAIRDDEAVAMALGIDVVRTKIVIFTIGGGFAALAGALGAFYFRFITTTSFTLNTMILLWAMVFVGGSGTLLGALAGPAILVLFPEIFRFFGSTTWDIANIQEALYGLLLVLLMLFRPQGIAGRRAQ